MTILKGRAARKRRVRAKIWGTVARPRLSVFRSARYIFAQLIDDDHGVTLASIHEKTIKAKATKTEKARQMGLDLAKAALEKGIKKIIFDRGGYQYHGRVKALADGAREGGLEF